MNAFLPPALAAVVLILMVAAPGEGSSGYLSYGTGAAVVSVLLAAAVNFRRLVVTFDGGHLVLRYGVIRKKIAVGEIVALEPALIKWRRFGGTGIRISGGTRGRITGSGPGVKIETTRGTTYANCERAERLAALVDELKSAAEERQP
jgi:hypothetical protein